MRYVVGIATGILLVGIAVVAGAIVFSSPSAPQVQRIATAANGLPVIAFAVRSGNPNNLTATCSYRLLTNFEPDNDYLGDLRRTSRPIIAVDGAEDETFLADKLQTALAAGKPGIRVVIVSGSDTTDWSRHRPELRQSLRRGRAGFKFKRVPVPNCVDPLGSDVSVAARTGG